MRRIDISADRKYNYVAFFLTLACNLRCPYCINLHGRDGRRDMKFKMLSGRQWVEAADRLVLRDDLPLSLQGGEPTLHKDFFMIVNQVRPEIQMDLLTNLTFDVREFIRQVPLWRFARKAPYAPIRVSYHPGQNDIDQLKRKTLQLMEAGFRIGIYGIEHPEPRKREHILQVKEECCREGIDFRTKEFLGDWQGELHGTFKYPGAVAGELQDCSCRTSELLVAPDGGVYRCHADLYGVRQTVGHILDPGFRLESLNRFRDCHFFGSCNPCDVKVKTNRFQQFGHTSCEIRFDNGKQYDHAGNFS